MIINRRMDGIATMTRLFVYKIVVLNNTFPSVCIQLSIYVLILFMIKLQLLKKEKMERFLHCAILNFLYL